MSGLGDRADALQQLSIRAFDVLVIGGGITGAGIALDAATRGLSVALVDARDFASGTSGRSSKLVHGGLRYLEQGEVGLVRQSARERELLRGLAPHLVWPVPFVLPKGPGRLLVRAGLKAYDLLAGLGPELRYREVAPTDVATMAAGLPARSGAFVYHDCGTDDSRLTLEVLRAAVRAGAVICNHVQVVELLFTPAGRAAGADARDMRAGRPLMILAADVVNAAGVWADWVSGQEDPQATPAIRPSKGIDLVLPRAALPLDAACLVPAGEGRRIFAVPWRSSVIVGPTDTDYAGPLEAPSVEPAEVEALLAALSRAFDRTFEASVVVGAYAGLRPLVASGGEHATKDLSRRHVIRTGPSGMVTITGGKLTTFRHMAEELVDLLAQRRGTAVPSVTASTPLLSTPLEELRRSVAGRVAALGLGDEVASSLVLSYGDRAPDVLDLAEEEDLAAPLVPGLPYLEAELVWGAREEMAATAEDLLARRTRIALEDAAGGLADEPRLRHLLARALGIPDHEAAAQVSAYRDALALERGPAVARP